MKANNRNNRKYNQNRFIVVYILRLFIFCDYLLKLHEKI